MKKIISITMMAILLFVMQACKVSAQDNVEVYVNNLKVTFGVQPKIENDVVYVHERPVFEKLGFASVKQLPYTTSFFTQRNDEVYMFDQDNNNKLVKIDNEVYSIDVDNAWPCSSFFSDRIQTSIYEIAERYSCDVYWDKQLKTVYFNDKEDANKTTTMYHPDGTKKSISVTEIDEWIDKGWYSYPITVIESQKGERLVVSDADRREYLNNGWLEVYIVSAEVYEQGIKKGIEYYNEGLYYEAIDEIQWFCDINWYNMTDDQQEKALFYLGQSKTNLADYSFETGKNYYNKGLYYEAKPYFESAIDYYKQVNYETQWQSANDYLYNTNEKIKSLENWIWVKDYYFNFIGKTRTQIDNILGPITETVWNNLPYYRHRNDRNTLFSYDNFVGADYMVPSYAICDGVETTVGGLVGVSNSYNNIAYGLRKVFTYDKYFIDECTKEWCWVYKHNGYVIMIDGPDILLNSRAYIYKE